jgi:hypothetical protein
LNSNISISATIGRIFIKSHTLHSTCMRYKRSTFVSDRSIIMATVSGQPCSFWLYLTFQWSDLPKKFIPRTLQPVSWLHLEQFSWKFIVRTHCTCITSGIVCVIVKNYLHFTWWAICLPDYILASIGEIFLKTQTSPYTHPFATNGTRLVVISQ